MNTNNTDHQYVTFPLSPVDDTLHQTIISHEEICEPDDPLLRSPLPEISTDPIDPTLASSQIPVEILTTQSDNDSPIYIKEEEESSHQYTSGDDESMAVEALRQLGGMYPIFSDKKVICPNCANQFPQSELPKHQERCYAKLSCTTCGESFERKQDLNNHLVCHQVDRPHACRTCGNLFRNRANLQAHMTQVHQAEKPHKCTICGADFQRPSSLSNHMKIHTYVAGRAIAQTQNETMEKWEGDSEELQNSSNSIEISNVQNVQTYDDSQVQWTVPSYSFTGDQGIVSGGLENSEEKLETMQEFTVMPNGEVTQFTEYTAGNQINQYNLSMNSFGNPDGMVKVESVPFVGQAKRSYEEVEGGQEPVTKSLVCSHCGANFTRATALASHEKIHASKNWTMPIECEFCDKQFQDADHLAFHQTTCAKKLMQSSVAMGLPNDKWGKHACTECGKKFTTKQKMYRHQWIHRKKTHSCEICGSQFEKQNQLDEHRLSAHPGDSPFTCSECGKSFVSRQGLWEHGRTHAGSPAHFQCDTCSKTFSSRQGYLIHHRTHTGERPYGCKFCWKAFRDGGTLRKHERIHTGERPHVCPLCSRAFNQKVVLREHVRWVHAAGKNETEVTGPPYPCPVCGALNQDRDELCAHIVKHSDQMIAEAKAKTNNNASPKPKQTKKKSKSSPNSRTKNPILRSVSRDEQNEALLSITEGVADKHNEKSDTDPLSLPTDKNFAINRKDSENIKTLVLSGGQNSIITKLRNSDINVLQLIQTGKRTESSLRFIAGRKVGNNTLNLITKQNESLPVLALSNPQSHEVYSSQSAMEGENDNRVENEVEQVEQYLQESGDEDEEMVCGICGDDFDDKNVLMEHVKIHI